MAARLRLGIRNFLIMSVWMALVMAATASMLIPPGGVCGGSYWCMHPITRGIFICRNESGAWADANCTKNSFCALTNSDHNVWNCITK